MAGARRGVRMNGKIAIAIPAYQAEPSIAAVVRRTLDVMPDLLVIDDGSTDGTAHAARSAGAEVLCSSVNKGKGQALAMAFRTLLERGYEAVVTLDADGQHLPEEVPKLIEPWRAGADLVIGSRARLFEEMARIRRLSNMISSGLISWVAGAGLDDVQSGFRLYTRRLVQATGFPEPRFEAESAVVVRASRLGMSIAAVPVRLGFADGRTTSHYRPVVDSLRIASAVIRARIETARMEA